jgi:uncharacterized Zn finger protein
MGRKANQNTTQQSSEASSKWSFITKEHLKDCFSSSVITRGMNYQKTGKVLEISFDGNNLKGVVKGTKKYKVVVSISNAEEIIDDQSFICLESICNCPYQIDCKHAVALLAELMENKGNIHSKTKSGNKEVSVETKKLITPETDQLMLNHFAVLKKDELATYALKLLHLIPQKYEDLMIRLCASSNDLNLQQIQFVNLVERLEQYGKDDSAEYNAMMTNVISLMKVLLDQKQFNVVIVGAKSVLVSRFKQYKSTNSGTIMLNKTAELIPILNEAIDKAKMPIPARFLFWLELLLWDTSGKIIKKQETIGKFRRDQSFWESVAADVKKVFEKRLEVQPKFLSLSDYQRVLDDLMPEMLKYAQKSLVEDLLRDEMAKSQNDTRLRQFYKSTKDHQRLREHIIEKYNKGFDHAFQHHKILTVRELISIAEGNHDKVSVLGLYIYHFFEIQMQPDILKSLFHAAAALEMKSEIADLLVEYLEVNISPFSEIAKLPSNFRKSRPIESWPVKLPFYLRARKPANLKNYINNSHLIAEVYIQSNQYEKLFDYYENVVSNKNDSNYNPFFHDDILNLIITQLKDKYPEKCIAYILDKLQRHLIHADQNEYFICIIMLKLLFDLFAKLRQEEQWFLLVTNIKNTFPKRQKFVKMLVDLENQKTARPPSAGSR